MFGLEEHKRKKAEDFSFELEKDLKNKQGFHDLKKKVESRIQNVKDTLRAGENKEEFDKFGVLLHGYTSFLKVISRFSGKS